MSVQIQSEIRPALFGLDEEFPETLLIGHDAFTQKYGCYNFKGLHGLACFSDAASWIRFATMVPEFRLQPIEVTFDEAREIAKSRPLPISCVMLLDNLASPLIHHVR